MTSPTGEELPAEFGGPSASPFLPVYQPLQPRWLLASTLFLLTLFTTTTLGAAYYLSTRTDVVTDLALVLDIRTIRQVWENPVLLVTGLQFSVPMLFILTCHELGHYLTCRRYGLPATLPYFLPAPIGLGTLGAFIKIRAPVRTKTELLTVGAAGPIAGFVALLPFLVYGIARSTPAPLEYAPPDTPVALTLVLPGKCLAIELITRLFHGPLPPDTVLDLHPFALAAWVGLLATALNLLPLGQLDGGHIFYAAHSRLQRRSAWLLWVFLVLASSRWSGWLLWCVVVLVMGLKHPPVYDETVILGPQHRRVALICFVIFVLSFIPVPISFIQVAG